MDLFSDKYNDIINRVLDELRSNTDITQMAPGSKARALLEIISRELATVYNSFNTELSQVFIKNASGKNLDLIGELVGLTRKRASLNKLEAEDRMQRFYLDDNTFGDLSIAYIPAGTEVSTKVRGSEIPITYVVTAQIACSAAAQEVYVPIRAQEFGTISNVGLKTLTVHNFEAYTGWDPIDPLLKTENIENITYAIDDENDASFRFRIANATLANEGANTTALRLKALSISGVADVLMDEYSSGIGTGTMYIKGIMPNISESLIANVQSAINGVKAFGNLVEVKEPDLVGIQLTVDLWYKKNTIVTSAQDTETKTLIMGLLRSYIDSLDIGQSLDFGYLYELIGSANTNIKMLGGIAASPSTAISALEIFRDSGTGTNRSRSNGIDFLSTGSYEPQYWERIIVEPDNSNASSQNTNSIQINTKGRNG